MIQYNMDEMRPTPRSTKGLEPEMAPHTEKLLQELASQMVSDGHGEGYIYKRNYDPGTWAKPANLDNKTHILEAWVMTWTLPGTTAEVKVAYLCAINTIGSFGHIIFDKNASEHEVRGHVNDLWENRYSLYINAINDAKARRAERKFYGHA